MFSVKQERVTLFGVLEVRIKFFFQFLQGRAGGIGLGSWSI